MRVIFGKDGRGALNTKISLPITWLREMQIDPENREVTLIYNKEKQEITIKKQK